MILFNQNKKLLILSLVLAACGETKPKTEEEPKAKIVLPPERAAEITMLPTQFPDGFGNYMTIGPTDFVNGSYTTDITVLTPPPGLSKESEEKAARKNGIFMFVPGFVWSITPAYPVIATLSARGQSQSIEIKPDEKEKIAVSLLNFPTLYPPAFRERYELKLSSIPGTPLPFTYTYTFSIKRKDSELVLVDVKYGDGVEKLLLGRTTLDFKLAYLTPNIKCPTCTIEVTDLVAKTNIKKFYELPALPQPGRLRISKPERYSGLLIENQSFDLAPVAIGNNTSEVIITTSIPAEHSTVVSWCSTVGMSDKLCRVNKAGVPTQTYFNFLNAVPSDIDEKTMGSVGGVAKLSVSGTATVIIRRDGVDLETKKISFDSGEASPLTQPLPNWALDDLRSALTSGAGEFSK